MKKTTTIFITILVLALIILTALWLNKHNMAVAPADTITQSPVVITDKTFTETNFSGSRPIITGTSVVVTQANTYLDTEISTFKDSADEEVPDIRAQFGNDAPPSHYTIDFKATYIVGVDTESLVIDGYRYTGGANGMSFYKVFTARKNGTSVLSLNDVIKSEQQQAFAAYVRSELLSRQEAVFQDTVKALTFESFKNFAFDEDSLIIYFDKYDIGPGALGVVAFPLSIASIQKYLLL